MKTPEEIKHGLECCTNAGGGVIDELHQLGAGGVSGAL